MGRSDAVSNQKIHDQAVLAILLAILMVQTFVPWLGYIPLGPFSLTLVPLTVSVVASLLGQRFGAAMGLGWGILGWLRHLLQPSIMTPVFINPIISVVPRLLAGYLTGLLADSLKRRLSHRLTYILTGALTAFVNTIFVLLGVLLLARQAYMQVAGVGETEVLGALTAMMVTNGGFEMLAGAVLVPIISSLLEKRLTKVKK